MLRFIQTTEKIEKIFLKLSVFSFCLLIACQVWHIFSDEFIFLEKKAERIQSYTAVFQPVFAAGTITLKILDTYQGERLAVLLNKEHYAYFENNLLQLIVRDDDVVEIDPNQEISKIRVQVTQVTPNIQTPKKNDVFIITKQKNTLFTVKLNDK
ncbi:MAG TPA: hypothetical protein GX503_01585 [Clostridiales bacterium]|nr:hypothetical protein [Clostridiales bacterium]